MKLWRDLSPKQRDEMEAWLGSFADALRPDTNVLPIARLVEHALEQARLVYRQLDRDPEYQRRKDGLRAHYVWALRQLHKDQPFDGGELPSERRNWSLNTLSMFPLPPLEEGVTLHESKNVRLRIAVVAALHVNCYTAEWSFWPDGLTPGYYPTPQLRDRLRAHLALPSDHEIPPSPVVLHILGRGPGNPDWKEKVTATDVVAVAEHLLNTPGSERRYFLTEGRRDRAKASDQIIYPRQLLRDLADRFSVTTTTIRRKLRRYNGGQGWYPERGFERRQPVSRYGQGG